MLDDLKRSKAPKRRQYRVAVTANSDGGGGGGGGGGGNPRRIRTAPKAINSSDGLWFRCRTISGQTYYAHAKTNQTRWDLPPGITRAPTWNEERFKAAKGDVPKLALEHASCPICFEEFCKSERACAFFAGEGGGARACPHFVCAECAPRIDACPLCRTPIAARETFNLNDVRRVFELADVDRDGRLSKTEVGHAIGLVLHCSQGDIRAWVDGHWAEWNRSQSGAIEAPEFRAVMEAARASVDEIRETAPPTAQSSARQWFDYHDTDRNGTLDMREMRFLFDTYRRLRRGGEEDGDADADAAWEQQRDVLKSAFGRRGSTSFGYSVWLRIYQSLEGMH